MKKIIKQIYNNKNFSAGVIAIISHIALCGQGVLSAYNVYSWIIFFLLFIVFKKVNIDIKKIDENKGLAIIAILFSTILISGRLLNNYKYYPGINFWSEFFNVKLLFHLIGNFNIIFLILVYTIPYFYKLSILKTGNKKNSIVVYITTFIIIFICWIPYFLAYYPGGLTNDSIDQLTMIVNNFSFISNHHPITHTLFLSLPFKLGMKVFSNINSAIALVTITQMIIMACIFAYLILFLYKRKINKNILLIILAYFALLPMHGCYSITMWKDVIFAGLLLLLTIQLVKIMEQDKITLKSSFAFILISLLNIFFRNNAIYAYCLVTIFSFIVLRKHYKKLIVIFLIIYSTYFFVNGPVFNYFNVSRSESAEYIGMPLQQIGRMTFKKVEFTTNEKQMINKLIPISIMKKVYVPETSDGIKFNRNYNSEEFDKNKKEYLALYLKLIAKHPDIASEAYLISTLGYWYPGVRNWTVANYVVKNNLGIYADSKLPKTKIILDNLKSHETPIINMSWSIGLSVWFILLLMFITKKRIGFKYLYCFVPVIGIWVTMMLASPVYGEFRYVYGFYTCLPLLCLIPYLFKKINSKNIDKK